MRKVHSFFEVSSLDIPKILSQKVKEEIESKGKEYILGVDEEEYKLYLKNHYTLEPLIIDLQNPLIHHPTVQKEWFEDRFGGSRYQKDVYIFRVSYSYTGDAMLFQVKPNPATVTSLELEVDEQSRTVSYTFKLYKQDAEEFKRTNQEHFRRAFTNYNNGANTTAIEWNNQLKGLIAGYLQTNKDKYLKENNFFEAINLKANPNTASVFSVPTVTKKIIPQPAISKNKAFSSEPMMTMDMYIDVLKVIYDFGKNMEKKPSLYIGKDEESLRDQFILLLETRYEGTTASGETFNRGGKTDIILKYANDGSNLFVAECKFWHGAAEFLKAISQLFDRYLTWRDSKVALIIFVKNKEFSAVNNTILIEAKKHPYFVKEVGKRGETSFSYIFKLPQDNGKEVYFEIISFHYDKE